MESLLILVPIAIVLVAVAIWFFIWAVDHDQFEDLDGQGLTLFEDNSEKQP